MNDLPFLVRATSIEASGIEKLPTGSSSAMYWAKKFELQQSTPRPNWGPHEEEIEAAILDGAEYKYIYTVNELIVGAIAFNNVDTSIHVEHLGSLQKGVGSALMQVVEKFARRKKLFVTLIPSNIAQGFYKKLGYRDAYGGRKRPSGSIQDPTLYKDVSKG